MEFRLSVRLMKLWIWRESTFVLFEIVILDKCALVSEFKWLSQKNKTRSSERIY